MSADPNYRAVSKLVPGLRVEVRNHFDGSWSGGFEVENEDNRGVWLRRLSDREVLPSQFSPDELRTSGGA